jgi:hypothetical protein
MRKFLLFFGILSFTIHSFSQIAGPNNGSTFTNVPIPGSNKSWINMGNAASSDDIYTSYGSLGGTAPSFTDYLQITGFNFAIPASVIINGIVIEVERADPNNRTANNSIRIVKNGVIGTTERSSGAGFSTTDTYQTFGNSGDLWGETWTEADINSVNFGIAFSARRSVNGANAGRVDHIRVTVYYDFVVLPVKLTNFFARRNNGAVDLSWIANDESNMISYEVEKSVDGKNFTAFDNIAGRNQSLTANYSSTDRKPNRGLNYYRLKMTETTGRVIYSRIVTVHFSSGNNILIYPNPWTKGTPLNITNANGDEIRTDFYSMTGKLLGSVVSAGNTINTTPILNAKGLVMYKLTNKEGYIIGRGTIQVY